MTRWFRLYDEMLDDAKVQMLPPELFKTWINLLAVASRNNGALQPVTQLAFALRISPTDMQARLDELILAGLLDILPDGRIEPHNWKKRQWKSDDSADRVRKHRAKKEQAKQAKCNDAVTVTATAPEAETDTDTETDITPLTPQGGQGDMPSNVRPIANWSQAFAPKHSSIEIAADGSITLLNGTHAHWLESFGGDAEALRFALIEVRAKIQPNNRTHSLEHQVESQLAKIARLRRDFAPKPKAKTTEDAWKRAREIDRQRAREKALARAST